MKRRVLSILLSLCMIFAMLSNTSFATSDSLENTETNSNINTAVEAKEEKNIPLKSDENIQIQNSDEQKQIKNSDEEKQIQNLNEQVQIQSEDIQTQSINDVPVTTSDNIFLRSINSSDFFDIDEDIDTEYNVIVMDMSVSVSYDPKHMQKIADKIVQIKHIYPYHENIAVVGFAEEITSSTNFTKDILFLRNYIPTVKMPNEGGVMTNINVGLEKADELLSSVPNGKNIRKNVILLSDGLPNVTHKFIGNKYNDEAAGSLGPHDEMEAFFTNEAANAAYETAQNMKNKGYKITTVHFTDPLSKERGRFARQFMRDLQNSGYYDAEYVENLNVPKFKKTNISSTFRFPSTSKNKDFEETFYYDDSYFEKSSYEYNPSLSTMSLCLALSAFASSDEKDYMFKSKNAETLLKKIGFRNFEQNDDYYIKPKTDTIGAVIANKKLITSDNTSYTLIALAIRGGGYESEWAGNFTIGINGYHEGFKRAKEKVFLFLTNYIKKNNIHGKIKLWIVGYSRAGATANLVAGAINDGESIGKSNLNPKDMYVYTFEAPQGAIKNEKTESSNHKNIFNVRNVDDLVPYVAPSYWQFRRYAEDCSFPHSTIIGEPQYKIVSKYMKDKLKTIESFYGKEYKIDNFSMKKLGIEFNGLNLNVGIIDDRTNNLKQGQFLDVFINTTVERYIKTRIKYVNDYQEGIREILKFLSGVSEEKKKEFFDSLASKIEADLKNDPNIVFNKSFGNRLSKHIQRSFDDVGLYGYDVNKIAKAADELANLIAKLAQDNLNYLITTINNFEGIAQGHYPEICLAWLQSADPKYNGNKAQISHLDFFNNGKTRTVRINCPVDVEIYEENRLIGKVLNNEKVLVTDYDVFGLSSDGEKQAYIPTDGSYTIKILARDKGNVSYSVVENQGYVNILKIINFDNIPIEKGTVLKAYLPAFSDEDRANMNEIPSNTHYTLFNETKNKEILPTSEYLMDDAKNYKTMIDVETEDGRMGSTSGNGFRIKNAPVKVYAIPNEGYKLEGWYENGVKVSEEYEYTTKADKYRKLIAKFKPIDEETKKKMQQEEDEYNNSSSKGGGGIQDKVTEKSKDNNTSKNTDDKSNAELKKTKYTDIANHWAQNYIKYLEDKDILSVYKDNIFSPNKYITRAELLTMVVKMKNLKTAPYRGIFKDVNKDYPHADIIQTAYDNKIIKGYGDDTFRPDNVISRAEMSVMLISLAKGEDISDDEIDSMLSQFKDKNDIPDWSKKYMAWSVKNKLIEGYNGNISAKKNISRAEICTILYKIMTKDMVK